MLTTLFDECRSSLLSSVDSHDDEGRHTIQEATVIHLEVCFFQVEFQLTEKISASVATHTHAHTTHRGLHRDLHRGLLLINNSWCFNDLNGSAHFNYFNASHVQALN